MPAMPRPSETETRANACFDALLWTLSRPGLPRTLPLAGEAPIIEALLDRECRVFSGDPELTPTILRTGAEIAPLAQADHVFLGALDSVAPLADIAVGSDLYPDDGATVILRAQFGQGPRLRLTGPGVDRDVEVAVGGLPDGFWTARAQRLRYPMGFDVFLVDGMHVLGVPRSTHVEVL